MKWTGLLVLGGSVLGKLIDLDIESAFFLQSIERLLKRMKPFYTSFCQKKMDPHNKVIELLVFLSINIELVIENICQQLI